MKIISTICVVAITISLSCADNTDNIPTTVDVLRSIYYRCSDDQSMVSCAKPKLLKYLSHAALQDRLAITEDLSIVRSRNIPEYESKDNDYEAQTGMEPKGKELNSLLLEKVDTYLSSHNLEAKLPKAIFNSEIVPISLTESVPRSISVPLGDYHNESGRGFVKKVMIPFLLGLKFKATALVPLALALIALKTWKALTLGLLSLVLSGAMLIFKLTKPKIAYEVLHYGHPPVEHPQHWDSSPHGPYRAYKK